MRYPHNSISLATFGLAFAVALSPAFMQSDGTCTIDDKKGDVALTLLELEVAGENLIPFDPFERQYDVVLPEGVVQVTVRAQSRDPESEVMYNISVGAPPPFDHGHFEIGGGEITFDDWPDGDSILRVYVHAPGGASDSYDIHVTKLTP